MLKSHNLKTVAFSIAFAVLAIFGKLLVIYVVLAELLKRFSIFKPHPINPPPTLAVIHRPPLVCKRKTLAMNNIFIDFKSVLSQNILSS